MTGFYCAIDSQERAWSETETELAGTEAEQTKVNRNWCCWYSKMSSLSKQKWKSTLLLLAIHNAMYSIYSRTLCLKMRNKIKVNIIISCTWMIHDYQDLSKSQYGQMSVRWTNSRKCAVSLMNTCLFHISSFFTSRSKAVDVPIMAMAIWPSVQHSTKSFIFYKTYSNVL